MLNDGLSDDGESQADPFGFTGDEGFEQLGCDFGRGSGAVIEDFKDDIFPIGKRADFDVSSWSGGFDAVHHEVEQGVAEGFGISVDLQDLEGGKGMVDFDARVLAERLDERFDLCEEDSDVKPADGTFFLFSDGEETFHVFLHDVQLLECDREAFLFPGGEAAAFVDLDGEPGSGEGIAHLMRESPGELPEDARSFGSADEFAHGTDSERHAIDFVDEFGDFVAGSGRAVSRIGNRPVITVGDFGDTASNGVEASSEAGRDFSECEPDGEERRRSDETRGERGVPPGGGELVAGVEDHDDIL